MRKLLVAISIIFLLCLCLSAVFAEFILVHDPNIGDMQNPYQRPSAEHVLGTDRLGRDVFTRLVYGGRISLSVGAMVISIQLLIGLSLGLTAGYFGGALDNLIMRITDMFMAMPQMLLIIVAVAILGPSIFNMMLVLGIFGWPAVTRLVRGQVLTLKNQEFILAAHSIGVRPSRIIIRHLMPNVVTYLIVFATFGVADIVIAEAGLSFLGLGVQPPTASWGNMLQNARQLSDLTRRPWLWLPPGILISVTVLSTNFIGDWLRDNLDPHSVEN